MTMVTITRPWCTRSRILNVAPCTSTRSACSLPRPRTYFRTCRNWSSANRSVPAWPSRPGVRVVGARVATRTAIASSCARCSAHCTCGARVVSLPVQATADAHLRPLAVVLAECTTPELLYLESKFSGLVSYGLSARLLAETLPIGRPLHATAVRLHAQQTAERLEGELGPEQSMFIDGCQRDWDRLPRPDLPLMVGLDGGY